MNQEISNLLEQIPKEKILSLAQDMQIKLKEVKSFLGQKKLKDEWGLTTTADIAIEKILIKYFDSSCLRNKYYLKSEESAQTKVRKKFDWQLLVDPLDGTSAYKKEKNTWGVMVGLCDAKGQLNYSWNLVSNGATYTNFTKNSKLKLQSFQQKITNKQQLNIDVYDYKNNIADKFKTEFENQLGINARLINKTSYPAAVWTGWQLSQGQLDGLLWLPSNTGKKWYPDYDLIFLGALQAQGYKIILGKVGNENALIAVATTKDDVKALFNNGLNMIDKKLANKIKMAKNPLLITTVI